MELFFSPNGRIDQPTYWRAVLILAGASAAITFLSTFVSGILGFVSLVVIWCWIAVHAKRFHDNGKSGWYMLILIVISWVLSFVLGSILPGLFGFDQAAYEAEVQDAMSGGGFMKMMEVMAEAQRATIVPNVLSTFIITGALGAIMSLFKTDPNDNQYGPGPAGAAVAFN